MSLPGISFIVSTCDDPENLQVCLASLCLQRIPHEIIVADNSLKRRKDMAEVCAAFGAHHWKGKNKDGCYTSAECAFGISKYEWVGFPSSDSYYVPRYSEVMLQAANTYTADFVYCDCVYDQRLNGRNYSLLYTFPQMQMIDKTCFLLRSEIFGKTGFPPQPDDFRDGALAEAVIQAGIRHIKAPGILVVHN